MQLTARARRRGILLASVLVVFSLVGFLVLPPIIKSQLEERLSAALDRPVQVGKVRFNPYTLSLTLEQFGIRERNAPTDWIGWERLFVNFDLTRSLWGAWTLGAIELDGFHAAVTVQPDGTLNFSDLIARFGAGDPAEAQVEPTRPVRILRLQVNRAQVDFSDLARPQPFHSVLGPVTFGLRDFQTAGGGDAPYHFAAVSEAGERLTWMGTLAAAPFRSAGELRLENINLPKYAPYYASLMRADLNRGTLDLGARYVINLSDNARVLQLDDGELHLRDFAVTVHGDTEPLLQLPALDVTGLSADALATKAHIGRIAVHGVSLRVERAADGTFNGLRLLPSPAPTEATAASAAPAPLPDVTIDELAVDGFAADFIDYATPQPAHIAVKDLQASVRHFTLADGAVWPVHLQFAWQPAGTVALDGTVTLRPDLQAELAVKVDGVGVLPLSPYLEQQLSARFTAGSVTTAGQATLRLADGVNAAFAGDVQLDRFGLVDAVHNEPLVGWHTIALHGIDLATSPRLKLALDTITIDQLHADVVVNADRSINLLGLVKPAPAAPVVATSGPPPAITVGRVTFADGVFRFTDHSITPQVQLVMDHFSGTVAGLSSAQLAKAEVDLRAQVDGTGPVAITGQLDPLGARKFVDLKVDFKNVDLLPLGPYAGRYAGYELARGKLRLDVQARLRDRALDVENVVTLDQFTFGAATNSPDATSLPVRLGVALLKDTEGRIVLDVPVQGNLDDPNFRIGKVVVRVIVNLLTKAAVSPFSLLGSMFGGGGEDLAWQEFAPGQSALLPSEAPKLATMVKALTNRPGLSLGLEGGYDGPADTYALQRSKLDDRIRRTIWAQRHAADPNIPPPEQIEISPEETTAMLKQLFDAQFPPGTQFGTPLPPPPVVAPLPAPPKGWFKRLIGAITGKTRRELRAAKAANAERQAEYAAAVATADAVGLPPEAMIGRLAETMAITSDDLSELAAARARAVRDYLIQQGISADRLFLTNETATTDKGPRVQLSLQ